MFHRLSDSCEKVGKRLSRLLNKVAEISRRVVRSAYLKDLKCQVRDLLEIGVLGHWINILAMPEEHI